MHRQQLTFLPMDETSARAIQAWRYEGVYQIYNMGTESDAPEVIAELLDRRSPYYAVYNEPGELLGFLNVGTSALVWGSTEPGIYLEDRCTALGLGMRPDATGKGAGLAFVQAGLEFVRQEFAPVRIRLYVLAWNERAIRVYERAGFQRIRTFLQSNIHGEREFLEMSRDI